MPPQPKMSSLVASDGTPLPMPEPPRPANAGADLLSAEMSGWHPALRSADSALLPERNTLVARVRDTVRNNGWASGAVQRYVDQAIGSRFRLRYMSDWRALGFKDGAAGRAWARAVERAFHAWAYDPRCPVDAGGRMSFAGLLGLAFRHRITDGECLLAVQYKDRPGIRFGTCLQVVDPDRLSVPLGRLEDETHRAGVDLDPDGAPLAYHIRVGHPHDRYRRDGALRWEQVPAVTEWGRRQVVHFFEQEQAGQTRGRPMFAAVLDRLRMEGLYSRFEMQRALVNAMFAALIKTNMDPESLLSDEFATYQDAREAFYAKRTIAVGGVKAVHMMPGDDITFPNAGSPNAGFAMFEEATLRNIAAAIGQSYEQLAQDWTKTNYSSARAALLESWKFLSARRGHFAFGVAVQIFALWLEEALEIGAVEMPPGRPDFWEFFPAYTLCDWIGPGRGWVDPTKEAQASAMRMDSQLTSWADEAAEQGKDIEDLAEQLASEQELRREAGLPDPNWMMFQNQAAVPPAESDDPDAADREQRRTANGG